MEKIQKNDSAIIPEWIRVSKAEELFGLKRGKLYQLMKEGRIVFSEIRERGAKRGVRLISSRSLEEFITSKIVHHTIDS